MLPVIEPRPPQVIIIDPKSQRPHQPQLRPDRDAGAADAAGVVRNLRLMQDNIEHRFVLHWRLLHYANRSDRLFSTFNYCSTYRRIDPCPILALPDTRAPWNSPSGRSRPSSKTTPTSSRSTRLAASGIILASFGPIGPAAFWPE